MASIAGYIRNLLGEAGSLTMNVLGGDEGLGIVFLDNLNRAFLILPIDDDMRPRLTCRWP